MTQVMGSSIYNVGWQPTYYNVPTEVTRALGRLQRVPPARPGTAARGGPAVPRRRRRRREDRAGRPRLGAGRDRVHRRRHRRAAARAHAPAAGRRRAQRPHRPGVRAALRSRRRDRSGSPRTPASTTSPPRGRPRWPEPARADGLGWHWTNQELVDFSQGVYEAREKAMGSSPPRPAARRRRSRSACRSREHGRTHAGQTRDVRRPRTSR